jgi:hypothetical protein
MATLNDRHVPAETNGGWGFATFVIGLAVLCIVIATWVHKETYKHPTDVTWHGIGSSGRGFEGPGGGGH